MPDQNAFITVFRSADRSAERDASDTRARLAEAGIDAIVVGDDAPGVVEGSWEIRVPEADRARAEACDFLLRHAYGFTLATDFIYDQYAPIVDDGWRFDQPLRFIIHHTILQAAGEANRVELRLQQMRQEGRRV